MPGACRPSLQPRWRRLRRAARHVREQAHRYVPSRSCSSFDVASHCMPAAPSAPPTRGTERSPVYSAAAEHTWQHQPGRRHLPAQPLPRHELRPPSPSSPWRMPLARPLLFAMPPQAASLRQQYVPACAVSAKQMLQHGEWTGRGGGCCPVPHAVRWRGTVSKQVFCFLGRFARSQSNFRQKRKIAVQFCKISDESTAIWRFFRLRFGARFV
eukprot:scaffold9106_cov118-Isochrysis_galbana.AAC.4